MATLQLMNNPSHSGELLVQFNLLAFACGVLIGSHNLSLPKQLNAKFSHEGMHDFAAAFCQKYSLILANLAFTKVSRHIPMTQKSHLKFHNYNSRKHIESNLTHMSRWKRAKTWLVAPCISPLSCPDQLFHNPPSHHFQSEFPHK